jgi:hypothetical protein
VRCGLQGLGGGGSPNYGGVRGDLGRRVWADMRHSVYALFFALLAVIYVLPLWLVPHPPAVDLPAHLALATVVSTRGAADDPYSELFILPNKPRPNTLYYYGVAALGRIVPLDVASTILLSLALLLTPVSLKLALHARHVDTSVSLLGFALATSFSMIFGFVNFTLGIPFAIAAAALARQQAERPSWLRALLLTIVLAITFLAHAQLMLAAVGLNVLIALCVAARGRRTLALLATVGPAIAAVAPALHWYLCVLRRARRCGGFAPEWNSLGRNLRLLPSHTFDFLHGHADVVAGGLVVVTLVALVFFRSRQRDVPLLRRRVFDLVALVHGVCYFALPASINEQYVISQRHAVLALLFLCAAVDVDVTRRASRWILGFGVAATATYGLVFAEATLRLGREEGDLEALFRTPGAGARLAYVSRPRSAVFRYPVYRTVGCYAFPWSAGVTPVTFARLQIQPIRSTAAAQMPDPGRYPNWKPGLLSYDAVLSGEPLSSGQLALIGESGPFRMYRVIKPTVGVR